MKRIPQKLDDDCGVACVATLVEVSYAVARSAVFGEGPVGLTSAHNLRKALRSLGVELAVQALPYPKSSAGPARDALVKANVRSGGTWHWVVWDAGRSKVIDPKVPPYKRLRPHSYYPVTRPS